MDFSVFRYITDLFHNIRDEVQPFTKFVNYVFSIIPGDIVNIMILGIVVGAAVILIDRTFNLRR